jgi:hypothetical protein
MAKTKKTKVAKEAKTTETKTAPATFQLATLARDNGKNPKAVRGRFRKLYAGEKAHELPQTVKGGSRWTFAETDREAVTALMNSVGSSESDGSS